MALVEAEKFDNRIAAEIARGFLASAGVTAILFDDGLASLGMGSLTPVRLMVDEDDLDAARDILAEADF
jgi:hypothetical protein